MADETIRIFLDGNGELNIDKPDLYVREDDTVSWVVEKPLADFVVSFCPSNVRPNNPHRSPLPKNNVRNSNKNSIKAGTGGKGGRKYSYAVAALEDLGDGKVRLYALDPEVRVGPPLPVRPR